MNTQVAACIFIALSAVNVWIDVFGVTPAPPAHIERIEGAQ